MTMDPTPAAERRRQELKEEAYYLVLKALMFRDRPDMTLLTKLRLELSIGTESHKQWMTELLRAKQAGTLGMHVDARVESRPAAQNQSYIGAQQLLGPTRSSTPKQQQQQLQSSAGEKHKGKLLDSADKLPQNPVHLKVQFYRSPDGWYEGVITEYNPELRKIRVNVLNTKKVEWLEYNASPCLIVHSNARVTDLSAYV